MLSAFGVEHTIAKADRRFKPERSENLLHLPKHSVGAQAVRQAAQNPRALPPAVAIRAGLRSTRIALKAL